MDPMWFYDEMGDREEWQVFRRALLPLEKEHLEIRVALRDARGSLHDDPGNDGIAKRVENLEKRLEETDRKAPWISADAPWEFFLWGVPHG